MYMISTPIFDITENGFCNFQRSALPMTSFIVSANRNRNNCCFVVIYESKIRQGQFLCHVLDENTSALYCIDFSEEKIHRFKSLVSADILRVKKEMSADAVECLGGFVLSNKTADDFLECLATDVARQFASKELPGHIF